MKFSVDPEEIKKFENSSGEWENPEGEFKILRKINPLRISYVTEKISEHFPGRPFSELKILDAGCGGGLASIALAEEGFNVTGLDACASGLESARSEAEKKGLKIDFRLGAIEDIKGSKFDCVICMEVIEHIPDLGFFIENLTRAVSEKGIIIISTFNRTVKSYLLGIIAAEYLLGWVAKGTHDYKKFVKPSELSRALRKNGFSVKEIKGLSFNLFKGNWFFSEDIGVNYFLYATKNCR